MEFGNTKKEEPIEVGHAQLELEVYTIDDGITKDRLPVINENIGAQEELRTIMYDDEEANNQQSVIHKDPVIKNSSPQKLDSLHVNLAVEETLDLPQVATVIKDAGAKVDRALMENRRVVETFSERSHLPTISMINDVKSNLESIVEYADEPLLPLAEACAALVNIVYNLPFYVQLALNETASQPPDGLTVDESAAIRLYTIEWQIGQRSLYSMLNYTLTKDTRTNLRPYFKYLKLFLTALLKLPLLPPQTIWRGVTKDLSAEFPPDTIVIWWGFASCTTSLPVLENNMYLGNANERTLFSVEVNNGRTIRAHSHFVTEDEILLLPGTQMIVQSKFSPAPDLHIIHLKQVLPKEVLLKPPFEGALLYPKKERAWYRKKKLVIPVWLLTIVLIGAIILGSLLGNKSDAKSKNLRECIDTNWYINGITLAGNTSVPGKSAGYLYHPYCVVVDSWQTIYICDQENNRIQQWLVGAPSGTTVAGQTNTMAGATLQHLHHPSDLAINSSGFYIADTQNHRIIYWPYNASSGTSVAGNGTAGNANNQLYKPLGLELDLDTNALYIADTYNHRVMRYFLGESSGTRVAGGNIGGMERTQLCEPRGLYYNSSTNSLLIANNCAHNIVHWKIGDSSWTLIAGSHDGMRGNSPVLLDFPTDVTLDSMGHIYVADEGNQRIQFYLHGQSHGITIAGHSSKDGSTAFLLDKPLSVALDNETNLYVAEYNNHRVQKFSRCH